MTGYTDIHANSRPRWPFLTAAAVGLTLATLSVPVSSSCSERPAITAASAGLATSSSVSTGSEPVRGVTGRSATTVFGEPSSLEGDSPPSASSRAARTGGFRGRSVEYARRKASLVRSGMSIVSLDSKT